MRVGIIGAGSIGLLFAAYLSRHFEVNLYTRTESQARVIHQHGILLRKDTEKTIFTVTALPISEWRGTEELTIVAVKQYQLPTLIERMNQLPTCPDHLLFLQNGMGHLKRIDEVRANNLYVGTVEHGAAKENDFTVSHNGEGITNVAVYRGNASILQQFAAASSSFPIVVQADYYQMLVNKLIINAIINPLTAVLKVKNGCLIENLSYFNAVKAIFSEISEILDLDHEESYLELVVNVCNSTAKNRSSMLKDVEAHRPTEVDAILGFLLDEADRKGKKAAQIHMLYHLIKGKEIDRDGV